MVVKEGTPSGQSVNYELIMKSLVKAQRAAFAKDMVTLK